MRFVDVIADKNLYEISILKDNQKQFLTVTKIDEAGLQQLLSLLKKDVKIGRYKVIVGRVKEGGQPQPTSDNVNLAYKRCRDKFEARLRRDELLKKLGEYENEI